MSIFCCIHFYRMRFYLANYYICILARGYSKFVIVVKCRKNSSLFSVFRVRKSDTRKAVSDLTDLLLIGCPRSMHAPYLRIGRLYRPVGYSESARRNKAPADLLLSISRFSFRGLPPSRMAGKGSGTLIVDPTPSVRPCREMCGESTREFSSAGENLIKARHTPPLSSSFYSRHILICIQ